MPMVDAHLVQGIVDSKRDQLADLCKQLVWKQKKTIYDSKQFQLEGSRDEREE